MKPSIKPQHINKTNWYYEDQKGITLVHEVREPATGDYIRTDQIRIPWATLQRSMERCLSPRVAKTKGVSVSKQIKTAPNPSSSVPTSVDTKGI